VEHPILTKALNSAQSGRDFRRFLGPYWLTTTDQAAKNKKRSHDNLIYRERHFAGSRQIKKTLSHNAYPTDLTPRVKKLYRESHRLSIVGAASC
jgi:hypothetical protein